MSFVFSVPKFILTAVNPLVTDSKSSVKQNDGTYHQKNMVCCFPLSLIETRCFPTAELCLRELGQGNGNPAEIAALPLGGQCDGPGAGRDLREHSPAVTATLQNK